MDPETVTAKMREQVDQAQASAMYRAFGWQFEIDDLRVYITVTHRRAPHLSYLLRVSFEDFPQQAPSYVFVDQKTKEMTENAWPCGVKLNDSLPGICTPGTREFHSKYHRTDAQYPWDPGRYPFLDTLSRIHQLMEKESGR